jgi:DNA-binding transcriptional ArsR family regulator
VSTRQEPRLARAAAMVADPARSLMLAYLLGGQAASAGELARAASVSPASASGHLARLMAEHFVACEPRGRHRYYRLADADVAHALEALALVAERGSHDAAWAAPERARLREARCCYGHLAGRLGVQLIDAMHGAGALSPAPEGFQLTAAGQRWLKDLGLEAPEPTRKRRYAYACMDWSERRDHLAGQLADALLDQCIANGWLRRVPHSRALELTPSGRQRLLPRLTTSVTASRRTET